MQHPIFTKILPESAIMWVLILLLWLGTRKKDKKYDHQSHHSQRIPTFRRDFLYYLSVRANFRGSRKMHSH